MRRPFAMWIEGAFSTRIRGPQILLSGVPLGPAPEAGDPLCMICPFSPPIRVRCASTLSQAGGPAVSRFTVGIDAAGLSLEAPQCAGAILVEEGVAVRAFTARLRERAAAPRHSPARFDLRRDRAFGLVAVRNHLLNIAIVGGGLASADTFWQLLERIVPQDMPALDSSALERVSASFQPGTDVWQLPTIREYPRGQWQSALVVPPAGPVTLEDARLYVDGELRDADLYQQQNGLTQMFVDAGSQIGARVVITPFSAAA